MNHPSRYVEGIFDEPFETETFTGNPFFSQQFYETDRERGFVRGYSLMVYRPFGPASVAWGDCEPVPWGADTTTRCAADSAHSVGIAVMAEDLPEEVNRVDLDPRRPGRERHPRAARDLRRRRTRGGCSRTVPPRRGRCSRPPAPRGSSTRGRVKNFAHYMGTARMGRNPHTSVVNEWNQAHDVPNLFIVDGSSFTTSAGVNPTSTIGALALRAADGIWHRRSEWA